MYPVQQSLSTKSLAVPLLPSREVVPTWKNLEGFAVALENVYSVLSSSSTDVKNKSFSGNGHRASILPMRESPGSAGEERAIQASAKGHLKALREIVTQCANALSSGVSAEENKAELQRVEKKLTAFAVSAFLAPDGSRSPQSPQGVENTSLVRAKNDLVSILHEQGLYPVVSALRLARLKIKNGSFDLSFVEDKQVAISTVGRVAAFLTARRLSSAVSISPFDKDFLALIREVSERVQEIREARAQREGVTPRRGEDSRPTALQVFKALGIAADLLLLSHTISKGQNSFSQDYIEHHKQAAKVGAREDGQLTVPSVNRGELIQTGISEMFQNLKSLPSCADTVSLRGVTSSVTASRQSLVLQTTGTLDVIDSRLISLQDALAQLASISAGSAVSYQGDGVPNPRLTEAFLNMMLPHLPVDPRGVANPSPIKVDALIKGMGQMEGTVRELMGHAAPGGVLVGGLFQALSHQVPRGVDPLTPIMGDLSAASNGAHVEMTHFPRLADSINEMLRQPGILFEQPWVRGVGIPTSGGTASNNLSADLAFGSAGCGLALKMACDKLGVDMVISTAGGRVKLREIDSQRALMLHPEGLSAALRKMKPNVIAALREEFKKAREVVKEKYPPLVAIPRGEWVHYTLERRLNECGKGHIVRIPMNAKTEMDLTWLKREVVERFKDGPRPLILPLTLCNTGLGRSGCDTGGLKDFMRWFTESYGAPPLVVVDAAQGGITFGVDRQSLSAEIVGAREVLGEYAMSFTLDPHKTSLPVPCSVWVVKDPTWALFATGQGVSHSYLNSSDATELRESVQLSTPLLSTMTAWKFFRNLKTGEHNDMFAPVFKAADMTFHALQQKPVHVVVGGRTFRMVAPFEQHSGILGVCFVPVDGNMSMKAANEALRVVRKTLVEDRTSPISCSGYTLDLSAFTYPEEVKQRFPQQGLRWRGADNLEFLRFVFGQAGQEMVILDTLPKFITERFASA